MQPLKLIISALIIAIVSGCGEFEIFHQVIDSSYIAKKPECLKIRDLSGAIVSDFGSCSDSNITIDVLIHYANCGNADVKAFGADMDGYVEVLVKDSGKLIARAQSDFKGTKPTEQEIKRVYDKVIEILEWK